MKIIENKIAEKLIKNIVPKNILELNPVIAGGFITALYSNIINSKYKDVKYLEVLIKDVFDQKYFNINSLSSIGLKFGDIDLWFLESNYIWSKKHSANFLLSDFEEDKPIPQKLNLGFSQSKIVHKGTPSFNDAGRLHLEKLHHFNLSQYILNSTSWANTYHLASSGSIKVQFIKKPYKSIEELFSRFDILNCCAAYYNGKFYFHDDFEKIMTKKILITNNFPREFILGNIFSATRIFKYINRYDLFVKKDACKDLVSVFLSANSLSTNIHNPGFKLKIPINDPVNSIPDAYEKDLESASKQKIIKMIDELFKHFPRLTLLDSFDMDDIYLFVHSKNKIIKGTVKATIDRYEAVNKGFPVNESK